VPSLAGFAKPTAYISPPDAETTLRLMVQVTREALLDTRLRMFAEGLIRGLFAHDYLSEYAACLNWVRTHIRYSRDPMTIEQVKTPQVVMESETGDCDDLCTLIGTLVGQLGAKVRYVAGAFKRDAQGNPVLSHVWCEAFEPTAQVWVILDSVPGRNVATMVRKLVDAVVVDAIG